MLIVSAPAPRIPLVRPRRRPPLWSLAVLAALLGCKRGNGVGTATGGPASQGSALVLEAAENEDEPSDAAVAQRHEAARAAGEKVAIAAGSFGLGSVPGDSGRDPTLEPTPKKIELGAFEMDRLPYPNDPQAPPRTGVSRAEASELCSERSGRLCTEVEWERACKGPEEQPYAGGSAWDGACASAPLTCASGFGALAMGAALRELTASDVGPIKKILPRGAMALRGARGDAASVDHRCAHRLAVDPETRAADLGFRCCYGPKNDQTISSPDWVDTFRPIEVGSAELSTMFRSMPKLGLLSEEVKYFREDSAISTVERRGQSARKVKGLEPVSSSEAPTPEPGASEEAPELARAKLTTAPLLWSPVPGEELLVVTGRSGPHSFVVALHRFVGAEGESRYRVGSALILQDEPGPIVLAYDQDVRRRLHWMGCRGCYGEMGRITYREDNRVVITQY
jgi:hypothetical protein